MDGEAVAVAQGDQVRDGPSEPLQAAGSPGLFGIAAGGRFGDVDSHIRRLAPGGIGLNVVGNLPGGYRVQLLHPAELLLLQQVGRGQGVPVAGLQRGLRLLQGDVHLGGQLFGHLILRHRLNLCHGFVLRSI